MSDLKDNVSYPERHLGGGNARSSKDSECKGVLDRLSADTTPILDVPPMAPSRRRMLYTKDSVFLELVLPDPVNEQVSR